MKRISRLSTAIFSILFAAFTACAQGSRHDGIALGEQGKPVAGATVAVCTQPANVTATPCTPFASLYTDTTLTTPAPDPLTSDGLGNYHFYAAPGIYTVQIYGPGIRAYTTPDVILPVNPSNAQFNSLTATNAISALTMSLGGNLSVGGNAKVTGALTVGSLATTSGSNVMLEPYPGDALLWVSPNGSDANDGKSPGTAMATVYHALCSLPGGNCATQIAGQGTIYYFDGASANPTANDGIWLMGSADPNYASPPAGWLKVGNNTQGIAIIGVPAATHGPNGQMPRASIIAGTGGHSNPAIWLSNVQESTYFANMNIQYPGRGVVIGECSNGTRTGTCNSNTIAFDNVGANLNQIAGNGPAWDITGGSFWIRMFRCGGGGTDNVNPPTGDLAPAVLVDGRTNSGVGLIYIRDFETGGGGIKFYAGANGGSLYVSDLTTEGQRGEPAVWFAASGSSGDNTVIGSVENVTVSDATTTTAGVESDIPGSGISANGIFGQGVNLIGSMVTSAQYGNNLGNQVISPLRGGQTGVVNGWLFGRRDDVQRNFGLAPVRFANLASTNPSGWTATQFAGTTAFTQTGILAPDGTTNASQASSNNTTFESLEYYAQNHTLAVGDYLVAGAWVRSASANGFAGSKTVGLQIGTSGVTGETLTGGCGGDAVLGDGEWTWDSCIYKVTAVGSGTPLLTLSSNFNSTNPVQAYAPVLNYIPAGTISDNEAYAYGNTLKSYDSNCAAGAVCGLRFENVAGNAFQSLSANPAQSGVFRLADGDAISWRNHANTGDLTLTKNSSDQLVAPPLAAPTFFAPIVDSASGASGLTYRNSGSTVWTTSASASALSFNFNAHLGETVFKLTPFGGQSYAGLIENYGMAAGFVAVTESGGTMAFDAGLGDTFEVTLNANATSSTLSNAQAGQWLNFIVCQPASGGPFAFNWPGNVRGGMTIGTTAGKCSAQSFVFDGASAFATSPGAASQ